MYHNRAKHFTVLYGRICKASANDDHNHPNDYRIRLGIGRLSSTDNSESKTGGHNPVGIGLSAVYCGNSNYHSGFGHS